MPTAEWSSASNRCLCCCSSAGGYGAPACCSDRSIPGNSRARARPPVPDPRLIFSAKSTPSAYRGSSSIALIGRVCWSAMIPRLRRLGPCDSGRLVIMERSIAAAQLRRRALSNVQHGHVAAKWQAKRRGSHICRHRCRQAAAFIYGPGPKPHGRHRTPPS